MRTPVLNLIKKNM